MRYLAGCFLSVPFAFLAACGGPAPREAEPEQSLPVIAEPVRLGSIRSNVSATGVVTSLPGAEVAVRAHEPARIAEITKVAGDAIKGGEVLVRFEFPSLGAQQALNSANLKSADLRLRQARLMRDRVQGLIARGAASQRELDDAEREVTMAEGELAIATSAMRASESAGQNNTVRAPFTGTVAERLKNPGDSVGPNDKDPIMRLVDPTQVQVTATVALPDITRFVVGAGARAVAEGKAAPELLHVVSRPAPEPGATSVTVALSFDMPTALAPGTQVGIEIDAEQHSNVALVPAIAVAKSASGTAEVVVAVGGVAQRRPVVTGLQDAQYIEIISGLKAGELVVTEGHGELRDGARIVTTPP
jgi:membrane fusion protein (multidrug efflux system)